MKKSVLILLLVLVISLFMTPCLFATETQASGILYDEETFKMEKNLVLTWDTPDGEKKVILDAAGVEKLYRLAEEARKKGGDIEPEFLFDGKVKTDIIETAEGTYRLRTDYFVRFWRSGAYKSYFVISPVKGTEEPKEDSFKEFMVFHHHSELLEKERVMIRVEEGKEQIVKDIPSEEYGEEFLKFHETLADFLQR